MKLLQYNKYEYTLLDVSEIWRACKSKHAVSRDMVETQPSWLVPWIAGRFNLCRSWPKMLLFSISGSCPPAPYSTSQSAQVISSALSVHFHSFGPSSLSYRSSFQVVLPASLFPPFVTLACLQQAVFDVLFFFPQQVHWTSSCGFAPYWHFSTALFRVKHALTLRGSQSLQPWQPLRALCTHVFWSCVCCSFSCCTLEFTDQFILLL